MIRFLILLCLFYLGLRILKALISSGGRGYPHSRGPKRSSGGNLPVTDEMLKDPHCGVYFPRKEGVPLNVEGKTLFFCSTDCRDAYQRAHSR